jgi:hypothetical protein
MSKRRGMSQIGTIRHWPILSKQTVFEKDLSIQSFGTHLGIMGENDI